MAVDDVQLLLAIGTFGVAAVAAGASVYAVFISKAQLKLAKRAFDLPEPLVEVSADGVEDQPDWTRLTIRIQNRADAKIDIVSIETDAPKGVPLLNGRDCSTKPDEAKPWVATELLNPLPVNEARPTLTPSDRIGQAGQRADFIPNETGSMVIYAHLPLSRFQNERRPKVMLALRWRNHAASTFMIAANVISPKTA